MYPVFCILYPVSCILYRILLVSVKVLSITLVSPCIQSVFSCILSTSSVSPCIQSVSSCIRATGYSSQWQPSTFLMTQYLSSYRTGLHGLIRCTQYLTPSSIWLIHAVSCTLCTSCTSTLATFLVRRPFGCSRSRVALPSSSSCCRLLSPTKATYSSFRDVRLTACVQIHIFQDRLHMSD